MNFVTNFTNSSKNACPGLLEEDFPGKNERKPKRQHETAGKGGKGGIVIILIGWKGLDILVEGIHKVGKMM